LINYAEEEPCTITFSLYCDNCTDEFEAQINAAVDSQHLAFAEMAYQEGWRIVNHDPGHDAVFCSECVREEL